MLLCRAEFGSKVSTVELDGGEVLDFQIYLRIARLSKLASPPRTSTINSAFGILIRTSPVITSEAFKTMTMVEVANISSSL